MSRFIELYDDEGKRIWFDRKTTLDICDKSMDYLCRRLVGDDK